MVYYHIGSSNIRVGWGCLGVHCSNTPGIFRLILFPTLLDQLSQWPTKVRFNSNFSLLSRIHSSSQLSFQIRDSPDEVSFSFILAFILYRFLPPSQAHITVNPKVFSSSQTFRACQAAHVIPNTRSKVRLIRWNACRVFHRSSRNRS